MTRKLLWLLSLVWLLGGGPVHAQRAAPSPSATPLDGTATLSNADMEVAARTYQALHAAARDIACEIHRVAPDAQAIIFYRAEDYTAWRNLPLLGLSFIKPLANLAKNYRETNAALTRLLDQPRVVSGGRDENRTSKTLESVSGVVGDTTTALRGVLDLLAYFRGNVKIEGKTVTLDNDALRAALLGALRTVRPAGDQCVTASAAPDALALYDPATFAPAPDLRQGQVAVILELLEEIYELRGQADRFITLYDLANSALTRAQEELKRLTDNGARPEEIRARTEDIALLTTQLALMKPLIERLRQCNTQLDNFQNTYLKPNDLTGVSPLLQFLKAESLKTLLEGKKIYWLHAKPLLAGGNTRTRNHLLRFPFGADISHSGGVILEYMLSDAQGNIVLARTLDMYLKYIGASKIQRK